MVFASPTIRFGTLALAATLTAAAHAAPTAQQQTGDHAMGSQIRRVEQGTTLHPSHGTNVTRPITSAGTSVSGLDVSAYQGTVNWTNVFNLGGRFAFVKATEGTGYTNPVFSTQYNGAASAGLYRGAYHFGHPDLSTGAAQATFFVNHGGGAAHDGRTLPGVLDIEYNPNGAACYGLSTSAMVAWLSSFTTQYKALTGRDAIIYTSTAWWSQCTGNSRSFAATNPLWIARYNTTVGTLPYNWGTYTFWQFSDTGTLPGDQDLFNGSATQLQAIVNG